MRNITFVVALMLATVAGAQSRLQEAVDFLYRYMPIADKANHYEGFFREQARYALYARVDMPWGDQVPDSLWRHFVLPPRVNNEALDAFRPMMYNELRSRVQHLSMKEAALEVNHWCHEYVTYRPSDSRTSSPLATLRNGYGRCGEESVLAVAAMRTVGIPARQVYTPRWAHTDDNHAWIEVWVDGRWYFMGACEPEPVLNMAWFNSSAARALLMHTQVFGDWRGPEDVIQRNECFTEINCIANYVPTRRNVISVVDRQGRAVADALVEFKIFNYSEFCTIARVRSDAEGRASLTTGLGDMLVWASKDGRFGYAKMTGEGKGEAVNVTVTLDHKDGDVFSDDIDIVPPAEGMIPIEVTEEQVAANKVRLAREDSIRMARQRGWMTMESAISSGYDSTTAALLVKSQGNVSVIQSFVDAAPDRAKAVLLLQNLTDKDLRDVTYDVLNEAMTASASHRMSPDVKEFGPYVLSPRIEAEPLRTLRLPQSMLSMNVEKIITWVRDSISIVRNPRGLRITPQGVLNSRQSDARSRDIFFVALCRRNGIPARIESVSGRTEYYNGRSWLAVQFDKNADETARIVRMGKLRLAYEPTALHPDLNYYRHFTLTRIEDGVGRLLDYEEGEDTEMGAVVTAGSFAYGRAMESGYYMLTTGSRMSSGKVLAHINTFGVRYGRATTQPIALREGGADDVSVKGYFNADPLLPQTGRGYFIAMIGTYNEPTSHARQELDQIADFIDRWGRPVLRLDAAEHGALADELRAAVNSTQTTLPVVVVADSFGRIVFFSEGYNTSLGEQLKRTILHL